LSKEILIPAGWKLMFRMPEKDFCKGEGASIGFICQDLVA